jgi:uroporphyrinogen decarboxylase
MNGRDRTLAALEHREADRVPLDFGGTLVSGIHQIAYTRLRDYLGLPATPVKLFDQVQGLALIDEDMLERLQVDTRGVLTGSSSGWVMSMENGEGYEQYQDVWGITWRKPLPHGLYYDMVGHPLKGKTLEEARSYRWPEAQDLNRLRGIKERAQELAATQALILMGCCGMTAGLFQQLQWLLGYEYCFEAMASDPALTEYLIGCLAELDIRFWEWAVPFLGDDIAVVMYADDFGVQTGPSISKAMFNRYFKPWYATIFNTIKRHGPHMRIFFHTCGSSRFVLPDLIEAGIDILNPVQTGAHDMDPVRLKQDFGKDITFWGGGINTQKTLPRGSRQEIRDEVKRNIDTLAPGGGFVFATIHNVQADVPPENFMAMWEALMEFGCF